STQSSAASTRARSAAGTTGRPGPLRRVTEASEFIRTTSRPVPALGATAAVGPAVGQHREEVLVGAGDEGREPRAVDVPDRDPHTVTSCGTSDRTAATTRSGGMPVRQGCPGTGHSRAREPRHGAAWSPRTTTGTP